jgi:hypothetical protein
MGIDHTKDPEYLKGFIAGLKTAATHARDDAGKFSESISREGYAVAYGLTKFASDLENAAAEAESALADSQESVEAAQ